MNEASREEIRSLLPFFAAGTLSSEETARVRRALESDPALREDLAFWRAAGAAVKRRVAYEDAGHPSAEELVDFTDGRISDGARALALRYHIRACDACRSELERARATTPDAEAPARRMRMRIWTRLAVAAALVLGSAALLNTLRNDRAPAFSLHPFDSARSGAAARTDTLRFSRQADRVVLRVAIPAPAAGVPRYRVQLVSPRTDDIFKLPQFEVQEGERGDRQLWIEVDPRRVFPVDAEYQLEVSEPLSDSAQVLPETYFYVFRVMRAE